MELNVLKERETPLLSRKRYTLELVFKGPTPTRKEIRDAVASKVNSDPGLTVIKHVYTKYGVEKAKVIAHTYTKKEDMLKYEEKVLLDKHVDKKEEPKEDAEEKKEEPKEAPKEQSAEEKKE